MLVILLGFHKNITKQSHYQLSIKYSLELRTPVHLVVLFLALKTCGTSQPVSLWEAQFRGVENWSIALDTKKLFSKTIAHEVSLHLAKRQNNKIRNTLLFHIKVSASKLIKTISPRVRISFLSLVPGTGRWEESDLY